MTKFEKYKLMYEQYLQSVLDNPDKWNGLLETLGNNYKYNFTENVLIHLQRPYATACAEFAFWRDNVGRRVKYKTQGIVLLHLSDEKQRVRHVFDITDTRETSSSKEVFVWQLTDHLTTEICKMAGINDIVSAVKHICKEITDINIDTFFGDFANSANDTFFFTSYETVAEVKDEFTRLVYNSTVKAVCSKLKLQFDGEEDFGELRNLNADGLLKLGDATNNIANVILKRFERIAKAEREAYEHELRQQSNSGRAITEADNGERDRLRPERGATGVLRRFGTGGRTGQTGEFTDRQVRTDEIGLSESGEDWRADLPLHEGTIKAVPSRLQRESAGESEQADLGDRREERSDRRAENERPVEMGADYGNSSPDGGRNRLQGNDLRITDNSGADDNTIPEVISELLPVLAEKHSTENRLYKFAAENKMLLGHRIGDFYEFYEDDALILSQQFDFALTSRKGVPMVGIPYHTWDYIDKTVKEKGYGGIEVYDKTWDLKLPEPELPFDDTEPTVIIPFSEHPVFCDNEDRVYTFRQIDSFLDYLDKEVGNSDGYYKTDFEITYIDANGEINTYKGRYDIGDGDGGLLKHIVSYRDYYQNDKDNQSAANDYNELIAILVPYSDLVKVEDVLPVAQSEEVIESREPVNKYPAVGDKFKKSDEIFVITDISDMKVDYKPINSQNGLSASIYDFGVHRDNFYLNNNFELIEAPADNDTDIVLPVAQGEETVKEDVVIIEPPTDEQTTEQISFFDIGSLSTIPVERKAVLTSEDIDNLLRAGTHREKNSVEKIVAYFKKPKSTEDYADFLKNEVYRNTYRNRENDTAIGFISNGKKFSAYFAEQGIFIALGDTVFINPKSVFYVSWIEAATRIQTMLQSGTYTTQETLNASRYHETSRIADELWEIWRTQNKDSDIKIEFDDSLFTHVTTCLPDIQALLLNDRDWLVNTVEAVKIYADWWEKDHSIQRYNGLIFNPKTVSDDLNDLLLEEFSFSESQEVKFEPAKLCINTDYLELYFIKRNSHTKKKDYEYFVTHVDKKAQTAYIKNIYNNVGSGDTEYNFNGFGANASFTLWVTGEKVSLKWNEIAEIFYNSIKAKRYTDLPKFDDVLPVAQRIGLPSSEEKNPIYFDDAIVARYLGDNEVIVIKQYPNGKFYNHYGYDEQSGFSASTAGGFDTFEDAEKTLYAHRPKAKKVIEQDVLPVAQSEERKENNDKKDILKVGDSISIDGRDFEVESIDEDYVSLTDLTFMKETGFPISRREHIDFVISAMMTATTEQAEKEKIDFVMPIDNFDYIGGAKSKFRANVNAIDLLKKLELENRLATPEEQAILSKFVGWGGLAQAFDENNNSWTSEYQELITLLSPEEYKSAMESVLTAFYTEPVVIRAIYDGLAQLGFKGGTILEPAAGTGNFIGMMPQGIRENSRVFANELDNISGGILKQLYQTIKTTVSPFEKTDFRDNFFDVVIGNVPFGDFSVNDKRYNSLNLNIHDYFFAKSLDKVRPNGLIAFITSSGTLDKQNSKFRKYLAERAELLGAIRLPNTAFKWIAGTEVTSDIIFLQKLETIRTVTSENCDWLEIAYDSNGIPMNEYFVTHPYMIMGDMRMGVEYSLYGNENATACVMPDNFDFVGELGKAVKRLRGEYVSAVSQNTEVVGEQESKEFIPADERVKNYSFCISDGKAYYRKNSIMERVSPENEKRIIALTEIKNIVRQLLDYQMQGVEQSRIDSLRTDLNNAYDTFIMQYGYINLPANAKAYEADSAYYLLSSLENYDKTKKEYKGKADMFYKNTINPVVEITSVDSAIDALGVSLAEKGKVDIEYMAQLYGKSVEETVAECKGSIYRVPEFPLAEHNIYVTADEYLSGNIREKLKIAKLAAEQDDSFTENVTALELVLPKPLTATEIDVKIGAVWVPIQYYNQFMWETFKTTFKKSIHITYSDVRGEFYIESKTLEKSVACDTTYGTKKMNAYEIFEHLLNLKDIKVFDRVEVDGQTRSVLNPKETEKAQDKAALIKEKFADWIFRDEIRRNELVDLYNELYNSIRPREYDGSNIKLHGVSMEYDLYPHQRNALARTLYGGNTLLAHVVGAGKTFEMVASAMEAKYLGLCTKSLICVPNSIVGQFGSEFMQLYPNANILVTTENDFKAANRKILSAKIATGDYDAIIIGHTQMTKIPLSKERQEYYLQAEIDELARAIKELQEQKGSRFSIKQLVKEKKKLEEKLRELLEIVRDDVVTFEELGVDRIYIDEAHLFKNLFVYTKMSNVAGIQKSESQKAMDLYFKCKYINEITNYKGVIFATGTPVSNSLTELFTMQRYLQPQMLAEYRIKHFDAWVALFGEVVNQLELAPEGNGYRMRTRFAKFNNLPELMTMFKCIADIKMADDLNLNRPEAEFINVVAKPSEEQKTLIKELSERAKRVHEKLVDVSEDNMLLITSDGRKIGLDQRLINPDLEDFADSKVNICVKNVLDIYNSTAEDRLTQIIFCDFSAPKKGVFNLYDDIRDKLVAAGVPKSEIAFIHDYQTSQKKEMLFAKVNDGDVRILLGSTAKCGAGVNVQRKLIAIHHLDCPWRPADLEQREGRIIRQGNTNSKVKIYRYVTEGSFDAYLYQIIENKQKGISQVMTSKTPMRSCDDIDEVVLSYGEVKALCAGNPLIKEKMELDIEVAKLKRLKSAYYSDIYALEERLSKHYPQELGRLNTLRNNIQADISYLASLPQEEFRIELMGSVFDKRKDAGEFILMQAKQHGKEGFVIGEFKGFSISVYSENCFNDTLYGVTLRKSSVYTVELGDDGGGNITRIENSLSIGLKKALDNVTQNITALENDIKTAREEVKKPWGREQELSDKSARLREVDRLIQLDVNSFYMEVKPEQLSILDNAGINYEKQDNDGNLIIKINKDDLIVVKTLLDSAKNNQTL